ncbi:MAG: questin oxidase family protein [Collimonas sp.]|uniref:questin oxidase family protein n=1 Tax=Collimonas sp. TaxID=1963772 RepID=UPI003266F1D0
MSELIQNLILQQLLDANSRFALNGKGTTNHCPMALCALAAMGASPARLQDFFEQWERRFAVLEAPPVMRIERGSWPAHIGQPEAFAALRLCFQDWIMVEGTDAVLAQVLSRLPFAPASGAFHAVIRLSYGLEAMHDGEIAAGLAALVSGNLPVAIDTDEHAAAASASAGLAALSAILHGTVFQGDWITARMRAVTMNPMFRSALPAPPRLTPLNAALLDDMARLAIQLYWQTNNFTALHVVTGLHAARRVFSHLPEAVAESLVPDLWKAFCAAYVSTGAPPVTDGAAYSLADGADPWPPLFRQVLASNDEHDIKIVYTCYCENLRAPSALYHAAAARRVRHPG